MNLEQEIRGAKRCYDESLLFDVNNFSHRVSQALKLANHEENPISGHRRFTLWLGGSLAGAAGIVIVVLAGYGIINQHTALHHQPIAIDQSTEHQTQGQSLDIKGISKFKVIAPTFVPNSLPQTPQVSASSQVVSLYYTPSSYNDNGISRRLIIHEMPVNFHSYPDPSKETSDWTTTNIENVKVQVLYPDQAAKQLRFVFNGIGFIVVASGIDNDSIHEVIKSILNGGQALN